MPKVTGDEISFRMTAERPIVGAAWRHAAIQN
jgi:hypothetical protein